MSGSVVTSLMADPSGPGAVQLSLVNRLLDTLDQSLLVAERSGRIILTNSRAKKCLESIGLGEVSDLNLYDHILQVEEKQIFREIEKGEQEVKLALARGDKKATATVNWVPEPDWLVVQFAPAAGVQAMPDPGTQITVQELLQEREITYRNLLAAYLKLQEVNRQKTVFLASAAHELKTPLAVIKGYYDLLLAGSLGRLSEKQRDILEESKESCERLVRLVSMFLNYSALESGKLVLQLRENDMRDCLDELAKRWSDAFQRKGVRLEATFDPSIPNFRFDYQKVQQAAANLLDNALKHTPGGGSVTLRAMPHFWERRVAESSPAQERRRFRLPRPNSVEVSVTDSGPGIAPEHHQEIFEDFVRVDRNTTGMGLGLAIAKRLVQAHRGKIWVESDGVAGSKFTFLLPMDQI
ncbi:MAG TPA: HAMP domain-containing sensor histidine kinase [Candidatus Eisenbacteria bacterium]|jgi:signal transduction histidine kinase|nr:HAMP domain-containing sensor histidine kinase [Candidatus Eisenbacteria bacterium]